jgi:hypothetical protein
MCRIKALVCLGLLLAAPSLAEKGPSPALQDRFLREDLALAKSSSLYFVIQLKSGTMSLRAGGVTLKEWKVVGVRLWGGPHPLEPLTIEKKSTLFPPKRTEIKPATEEEEEQAQAQAAKAGQKTEDEKPKTPELEALELKDMPASFMLLMSDSTRVYFRPKAHKFLSRVASFGHSLSWYLWVPLKNLWLRLNKKPFSAIDIKLESPEDCQSIYWSLAEGAKGLIFPL